MSDDDPTANEWLCVMYEVWGLMRGNNELIQSRPSWSCKTVSGFLYILLYSWLCSVVNVVKKAQVCHKVPTLHTVLCFSRCCAIGTSSLHSWSSAYKQLLAYYLARSIVAQVIHSCIACTMIHSCHIPCSATKQPMVASDPNLQIGASAVSSDLIPV